MPEPMEPSHNNTANHTVQRCNKPCPIQNPLISVPCVSISVVCKPES